MPFTVTVESTLERDWRAATRRIAEGCRDGVDKAVHEAADEARRDHRYKDRTGNLTRSIRGRVDGYDRLGATGTVEATAPYASFVEEGTRPHEIYPRRAQILRWEDGEGVHYARKVNHPGTPSLPFMGPAALKVERVIEREVGIAVDEAQKELP